MMVDHLPETGLYVPRPIGPSRDGSKWEISVNLSRAHVTQVLRLDPEALTVFDAFRPLLPLQHHGEHSLVAVPSLAASGVLLCCAVGRVVVGVGGANRRIRVGASA